MPVNDIHSIWGSSPNDIWACGPGGGPPEWLQHFDGKKWTPYENGGNYVTCAGNTLFGFSQNNVWLGGDDGQIWHYDGVSWKRNYTYKADNGRNLLAITNLWGSRPDDLYACGVMFYKSSAFEPESHKGFILHFDGYGWKEILRGEFNSQFLTIRKYEDKVFVFSLSLAPTNSNDDVITFYELSGKQLKKVYSNTKRNIIWGNFDLMGDKLYFWMGREVYQYSSSFIAGSGNFIRQFSITEPRFYNYIFGRHSKDVFISTLEGLAHYNGEDVQYVLHYPETQRLVAGVMFFKDELFCAFYDFSTRTNMVVHGKLKE